MFLSQSTGLECTYHSIYPCVCLTMVYCLSLGSIGAGIGYDFSDYWVLSAWYSIRHKVHTKWTRTSANEPALYLRAISVSVIVHLLLFALSPCNSTQSLTLLKICVLGIHALEKEMANHVSVLAWRIPGTGEPGGLPSMGLHRVGHDWSDLAAGIYIHTYTHMYTC